MKNKSKKLWALLLAAVLTLSMGVSAFAAEDDPFWTNYPNMTNYGTGTKYNYVVTQGVGTTNLTDGVQPLQIQAADSTWEKFSGFTGTLYEDIHWDVLNMTGAVSTDVSCNKNSIAGGAMTDGGVAAKTAVAVGKNAPAGVAVVEAYRTAAVDGKQKKVSTMDFTFVINPLNVQSSVDGVNVYAYKDTVSESTYLGGTEDAEIETSTIPSGINYPTAMDAVSGITDTFEHSTIGAVENASSIMLTSMTIEDTPYKNQGYTTSWLYRVYDRNGNMMDLSNLIGAETFKVQSGYTVVWVYGNYDTVKFPEKFAAADEVPAA